MTRWGVGGGFRKFKRRLTNKKLVGGSCRQGAAPLKGRKNKK